jgi:hypothetical protein
MRNWLLVLLVMFLLVGPAAALTLPEPQAGVAFSLIDNKVNHFETMEIVTWKGLALSGGYMGEADATDHKIIATLNYDILSLIGVEWPITKYLTCKPGIYSGFGGINGHRLLESEFDWGLSLSVLQIKW